MIYIPLKGLLTYCVTSGELSAEATAITPTVLEEMSYIIAVRIYLQSGCFLFNIKPHFSVSPVLVPSNFVYLHMQRVLPSNIKCDQRWSIGSFLKFKGKNLTTVAEKCMYKFCV